MKKLNVLMAMLVFWAALLAPIVSAYAYDYDFSGTFNYDDDVQLFDFTVDEFSTVTIFSSSWLSYQGFDPMLGVWNSSGTLIQFQDDGWNDGATFSNGVEYAHGLWDTFFEVDLEPGDYFASVTQFNNTNIDTNFANGFLHDGNPNFTYDMGYGTQPMFNGVGEGEQNDPRTSYWEFHIINVADAEVIPLIVPEPISSTLFIVGGAALGFRRFRKTA